jgi:hypothetical protein
VEFSARGIHHVARCEVSLRTHRSSSAMNESYLPPGGGKVCDADCALRVHSAAPIGAADRKGAAMPARDENGAK